MKRSLISLAVLGAVVSPAMAQTSPSTFGVTMFGVIDIDARVINNGSAPALKAQGVDGLSSSRLGFRGNEDLGDGLKAGFWLETPILPDSGSTNTTRFWNRRSTVSLSSPTWGELRLGRDYVPLYVGYTIYDPFGTNGIGEIGGTTAGIGILSVLGSGANTIGRSDNQVSWFLPPTWGGVYGQLSIAPAEGVTGSKYGSGRIGYQSGGLDASFGYAQTTVVLDDKLKQYFAGASYDFGVVKVGGQVVMAKYASLAGGDREQKIYQVGVTVPVFGNSLIRADVIHSDMSGGAAGSGFGDADDANQFALGFQYNLSKRTALYTTAVTLRNKGQSRLVVANGNVGMKGGENSNGFDVGIRHSF